MVNNSKLREYFVFWFDFFGIFIAILKHFEKQFLKELFSFLTKNRKIKWSEKARKWLNQENKAHEMMTTRDCDQHIDQLKEFF